MQRVLVFMVLALSVSCENSDTEPKVVELEKFSIQIPSTWNVTQSQGYDSFAGAIEISSEESVTFDLGWYSSELNMDPATHDIDFTTIDGKTAKVVIPKHFGQGTTGVYFDSLESSKTSKFQMSGIGLTPKNQKAFLTAIRSLKFDN